MNAEGAIALTLKAAPVLSADTVPAVAPGPLTELMLVKSELGARTPEVPTVSTQVAVTTPAKGTFAVAALAEDGSAADKAAAKARQSA